MVLRPIDWLDACSATGYLATWAYQIALFLTGVAVGYQCDRSLGLSLSGLIGFVVFVACLVCNNSGTQAGAYLEGPFYYFYRIKARIMPETSDGICLILCLIGIGLLVASAFCVSAIVAVALLVFTALVPLPIAAVKMIQPD